MYRNERLLIGKNKEKEVCILPKMANRHGLITGASGSGKTITLKVMAESFSASGVPVFLVDVKGDLAGMPFKGEMSESLEGRIKSLELDDFTFESFPTTYYDVYGKMGHPIRTTVKSVGPRLLSRMLDLTDTQEEILGVVFKIAEDEDLELDNLNDLDKVLGYVNEKRSEYTNKYGNISTQSVTSIKRSVINLIDEGGNLFFDSPKFDIKDFMKYDSNNGYGYINVLDATSLFKSPTTYVVLLIWLLTEVYNELPEIGDPAKPKLVFFFDEAHLIFSEMKDSVVKQLIQIIKLIRSKGVGVYFISQSPTDIKDEILSQLGNRVQHVLRSYTKSDEKAIIAAANGFRKNKNFDTAEMIRLLGTGEALVSFQNEKGEPEIVEKVTILPPQSRMGTITDEERKELIKKSRLYNKYENVEKRESAEEKLDKMYKKKQEEKEKAEKELEHEKEDTKSVKEMKSQTKKEIKQTTYNKPLKKKKSQIEKLEDKVINKGTTKLVNYVFKKLFK